LITPRPAVTHQAPPAVHFDVVLGQDVGCLRYPVAFDDFDADAPTVVGALQRYDALGFTTDQVAQLLRCSARYLGRRGAVSPPVSCRHV
jgi:hypothetical protein